MDVFSIPLENTIFNCSAVTCDLSNPSSSQTCIPPQKAMLDMPSWAMGCSKEAYAHANVVWFMLTLLTYILLNMMRILSVPSIIQFSMYFWKSHYARYVNMLWSSTSFSSASVSSSSVDSRSLLKGLAVQSKVIFPETEFPNLHVDMVDTEISFDENGIRYSTNGILPITTHVVDLEETGRGMSVTEVNGYAMDWIAYDERDYFFVLRVFVDMFYVWIAVSLFYPIYILFTQMDVGVPETFMDAYARMADACPEQVQLYYSSLF